LPASFRGVPFLVEGQQTKQSGNKIVEFEYVNDSRRYDENLGTLKDKFQVSAIITGNNYSVNLEALDFALKDGSIGILIHPFYGEQNVVAKTWTTTTDTGSVGTAVFTIDFSVSDPAINPSISGDLISEIEEIANNIDNLLQSDLAKVFVVSSAFPENFDFAKEKLNSAVNEFNTFKSQFSQGTNTTDFDNQAQIFTKNIPNGIKNPGNLASQLSDLFGVANNISDDPTSTGNAFVSIFNFAQNDSLITMIPSLSSQAAQRILDKNSLNYTFCAYALMYAYLNFTQATFDDDQQLNSVAELLETQYLKIINGQLVDGQNIDVSTVISNETLDALESIRNIAREQFDKDNNNTSKIIMINIINPLSVSLLSYYYYGNTNQDVALIDLNNIVDVSFAKGNLNFRTQLQ
jgi:prophage DNA circulation protein